MRHLIMTMPILLAFGPAAYAAPWATSTTCTVTIPGDRPTLAIIANTNVVEEGERSTRVQIRIDTDTPVLADGARTSDASVEISGGSAFGELQARGSSIRDGSRVAITASDHEGFLQAVASGTTLDVNLPAENNALNLSFDLTGSAIAVRHLRKCLE